MSKTESLKTQARSSEPERLYRVDGTAYTEEGFNLEIMARSMEEACQKAEDFLGRHPDDRRAHLGKEHGVLDYQTEMNGVEVSIFPEDVLEDE